MQGQGADRSRAGEKTGQSSAVLRTAHRDAQAAKRCLTKAIRRHGVPGKRPIDGRTANEAAIKSEQEEPGPTIASRNIKYLTNMVAQDQRGVQRMPRPM